MRPFIATVAFTGGRVSECCGLQWGELDLDAEVLRIAAQLQGGQRKRTKTEAGTAASASRAARLALLREHRRTQIERDVSVVQDAFVFASATEQPMDRRRAHRVVQASARNAKLIGEKESLRVHDPAPGSP